MHYLYVNDKYTESESASIHHQQMATDYALSIARMLQEYDTGVAVSDTAIPMQVYSDMAYGSLSDAPEVFNAITNNLSFFVIAYY